MEILTGNLYFVSDDFFELIKDTFLKINYEHTKHPHYIDSPYIKGGQAVRVTDPKAMLELEKTAKKIVSLLRNGIHFTPTQPDVLKIERIMLNIKLEETLQ